MYIVVVEIQQSKALERIACWGCFEGSDKKYFKNVLDKLNKMRYYKQADSHKWFTKIWWRFHRASEKAVFLEN